MSTSTQTSFPWSIIQTTSEGHIVIGCGDNRKLLVHEPDTRLQKESGWYISREWNMRSYHWIDHARPGFGQSYWITLQAAKQLGLPEVSV